MATVNEAALNLGDRVDLEVDGFLVRNMVVMRAGRRGKCDRSGRWFDPAKDGEIMIAYKAGVNLTAEEKDRFFPGRDQAWPITVVLDRTIPQEPDTPFDNDFDPLFVDNISAAVIEQAGTAFVDQYAVTPTEVKKDDEEPSPYQLNIDDQYDNTDHHIFILALAGTGKTYSLIRLCKRLDRLGRLPRRTVIMAFNTKISDEMSQKIRNAGLQGRVSVMTTHQALLKVLLARFRELAGNDNAVDMQKSFKTLLKVLCDRQAWKYTNDNFQKVKKSEIYGLKSAVAGKNGLSGKIKNCCIIPARRDDGTYCFSDEQMEQIRGLIERYGITWADEQFTDDDVAKLAAEVVIRSIPIAGEPLTSVDGDDMIYLPLVLNLPYPQYDLILTDESQDFNACQIAAVLLFTKDGGRAVVVGDPNQAMYAFRGSESGAFFALRERLENTKRGVVTCDLPINYRCDEVIIEHARRWVPNLQGRGTKLGQKRGVLSFDRTFTECILAANNDAATDPNAPTFAFLCRTNVPLVVTAYALMSMGKRVTIVGRQVLANRDLT